MENLVNIELKEPIPSEGVIGLTYSIEGAVKFNAIGAPPWVYAEVKKKDWYRPDIIEETHYYRGFPIPISGNFKIKWKPEKLGIYEVTVVATPAPLSLPIVGVPPITGSSNMMKITISEKPLGQFTTLDIVSYDKLV